MIKMFFLTALLTIPSFSCQAQGSKLIAASCHADGGRCSGSAYCSNCSGCKHCKHCKHCNSGSTCGVCASYAAPAKKTYTKPAKKRLITGAAPASPVRKNTASKKAAPKKTAPRPASARTVHAAGDQLTVASDILSLREGAGASYPVIETLEKGAPVHLLGYDDEWAQVIVIKSKNVGYVKSAFLESISDGGHKNSNKNLNYSDRPHEITDKNPKQWTNYFYRNSKDFT